MGPTWSHGAWSHDWLWKDTARLLTFDSYMHALAASKACSAGQGACTDADQGASTSRVNHGM